MTSNLLQDVGLWIDYAFLLMLGGIPWQCYYQRVLSSKTSKRAVLLSYGGGLIALIMTIPSVNLIYKSLEIKTLGLVLEFEIWEEPDI